MNIDVNTLQGITFDGHDVQGLVLNGLTLWNKTSGGDDASNYFTVEVTSGSNVSIFFKPNSDVYQCSWYIWKNSIPNANKSNYTFGPFTPTKSTTTVDSSIVVSAGDKLIFYRPETTGLSGLNDPDGQYTTLYSSDSNARYIIYGNAASLMGYVTVCPHHGLQRAFRNSSCLTDASGLVLPWTEFDDTGYQFRGMFENDSNLVLGPALLPSPTISWAAYNRMFYSCSKLTTSPTILGTPNASNNASMSNMFRYCAKLNYVKCLALSVTSGTSGNVYNFLNGAASTGTFVKHPDSTGWVKNANCIPTGWTIQTATE